MKKAILLNLVVLLVVTGFVPAATRLVPDEYATIQAAIDAAVDGDVVIIRGGSNANSSTIADGGNFDLDGGAGWTAALDALIGFINDNGTWREMWRKAP